MLSSHFNLLDTLSSYLTALHRHLYSHDIAKPLNIGLFDYLNNG